VDACLGKGKTTTPFAYAGRLTEAVLLGLIAHRFPREDLVWDKEKLLEMYDLTKDNDYYEKRVKKVIKTSEMNPNG